MSTQIQTVLVTFPHSSVEVQAMEEIPVCPVRWDKYPVSITSVQHKTIWNPVGVVGHTTPNGTITTWSPCGTVEQVLPDGTMKSWLSKPTLADAIAYPKAVPKGASKNAFFQFHSDGSVTSRSYDTTWYWGPSKKGVPLEGVINRAHKCYTGYWVFDGDSDCFCTQDCRETADCLCETRPPPTADPMMRYSFWTTPE